uniref:Atp4 n=1 Tax=Prototheca wickerhamii TaxID=3111 RepID=A0A873HVV5_PROWI|nr:Atp4 [Prototheca wickerhamii]
MTTSFKLNINPYVLLYITLAFIVASSKHLIIYNEETLVVICFFGFIYSIKHYFGDTLTASIQERGDAIHEQLEQSYVLQIEQDLAIRQYYQQIIPVSRVLDVLSTSLVEQAGSTQKLAESGLRQQVDYQVYKMYTFLYKLQQSFPQKLQQKIQENVLANIQESLAASKNPIDSIKDAKLKLKQGL